MLPDLSANRHGYIRPPPHERTAALNDEEDASASVLFIENERFCIPEVLFAPSDIGKWDSSALEGAFARD